MGETERLWLNQVRSWVRQRGTPERSWVIQNRMRTWVRQRGKKETLRAWLDGEGRKGHLKLATFVWAKVVL